MVFLTDGDLGTGVNEKKVKERARERERKKERHGDPSSDGAKVL